MSDYSDTNVARNDDIIIREEPPTIITAVQNTKDIHLNMSLGKRFFEFLSHSFDLDSSAKGNNFIHLYHKFRRA